MINLKVEQYCDNCPEFEPDLETEAVEKFLLNHSDVETYYEHKVRCAHAKRCRSIANHFKEMTQCQQNQANIEKNNISIDDIKDILMKADAVTCAKKVDHGKRSELEEKHDFEKQSYLLPERYYVEINYKKLAWAIYNAIYKSGESK